MLDVDETVKSACGRMHSVVVADDCQLLALGEKEAAAALLGIGVEAALGSFRKRHLPIAEKKLVALASSSKTAANIT